MPSGAGGPEKKVSHDWPRNVADPLVGLAQTDQNFHQFPLAVAGYARNGHDAAAVQGQIEILNGFAAKIIQTKHTFMLFLRRGLHGLQHFPTDHAGSQFPFSGYVLAQKAVHDFPSAQNVDFIGKIQDFLHLVTDEDDGFAVFGHAAERQKQPVCFWRGKHGGGFIENEDPAVPKEQFQNFHALPLSHGQFVDTGRRTISRLYRSASSATRALIRAGVNQPPPCPRKTFSATVMEFTSMKC